MKLLKLLLVLIFVAFALSACQTIQPWDRGGLSKPFMIMDKNPIGKGIEIHHIEFREGSAGATGSESGGCGCG